MMSGDRLNRDPIRSKRIIHDRNGETNSVFSCPQSSFPKKGGGPISEGQAKKLLRDPEHLKEWNQTPLKHQPTLRSNDGAPSRIPEPAAEQRVRNTKVMVARITMIPAPWPARCGRREAASSAAIEDQPAVDFALGGGFDLRMMELNLPVLDGFARFLRPPPPSATCFMGPVVSPFRFVALK